MWIRCGNMWQRSSHVRHMWGHVNTCVRRVSHMWPTWTHMWGSCGLLTTCITLTCEITCDLHVKVEQHMKIHMWILCDFSVRGCMRPHVNRPCVSGSFKPHALRCMVMLLAHWRSRTNDKRCWPKLIFELFISNEWDKNGKTQFCTPLKHRSVLTAIYYIGASASYSMFDGYS